MLQEKEKHKCEQSNLYIMKPNKPGHIHNIKWQHLVKSKLDFKNADVL